MIKAFRYGRYDLGITWLFPGPGVIGPVVEIGLFGGPGPVVSLTYMRKETAATVDV